VKPEHEKEHAEDQINQFDHYVMSGKKLEEHGGYRPTNLGHGNECNECNYAVLEDMQKERYDHFKDGLSE
jgi:hypothetical protein